MPASAPSGKSTFDGKPITPLRRLRYLLHAGLLFGFLGLFRMLPLDTASALGGWVGRRVLAPFAGNRRALANIRLAFPDIGDDEANRIAIGMWDNLGRLIAEFAHLDAFVGDPEGRIVIHGLENARRILASGKGILAIPGHFANWEVMSVAVRNIGIEGHIVLRPPNNPYVVDWLSRLRDRTGLRGQIVKGAEGTRQIFTRLRRGEMVSIMMDQALAEGIPIDFFGRPAMTNPLPATLALRMDINLVPISIRRTAGAHFEMTIHPPMEVRHTGDMQADVAELTARINHFVEDVVRAAPEQWLWIHNRWGSQGNLTRRGRAVAGMARQSAE